MTIDLKWAAPLVLPFIMLGLLRAIWWAAGAAWTAPDFAASICSLIGPIVGGAAALHMHIDGIRWDVTLGKKEAGNG